jgi:hypothetical protein
LSKCSPTRALLHSEACAPKTCVKLSVPACPCTAYKMLVMVHMCAYVHVCVDTLDLSSCVGVCTVWVRYWAFLALCVLTSVSTGLVEARLDEFPITQVRVSHTAHMHAHAHGQTCMQSHSYIERTCMHMHTDKHADARMRLHGRVHKRAHADACMLCTRSSIQACIYRRTRRRRTIGV